MISDWTDKVAVITGGASGIGLALAQRVGAAGAKVVIADIEPAAIDRAGALLGDAGIDHLGVRVDVSRADEVAALADAAWERFGAVHLLANNAGVVHFAKTWEQTLEDWQWVLGIDLWGVVHGVQAFVPRMVADGNPGHVLNTASTAGLMGFGRIASYVAAKQAVVGLSETLLIDLRADDVPIGVSVLCPGPVRTGIRDSERNRPGWDGPSSGVVASRGEAAETISPEEVAEMTVGAIARDEFWILPHARYGELAQQRAASMLTGQLPPRGFTV